MSLLRRKRRQNRLRQTLSPATRTTRFVLAPLVPERGLRNILTGRRVVRVDEHKRPESVIESPYNPFRLDFNRELKQALAIQEYNKIRQRQSKFARKALYTIHPDQTVRVDLPPEHPICIQREERRMVMFATGKTGKGGQKPRHNNNITLRCK